RGKSCDYTTLVQLAEASPPFASLINPDDARFLSPAHMPAARQGYCRDTGQPIPDSEGALVRCCLESLALMYATVLGWIEELTGQRIENLHIVGGGSRNTLLHKFNAHARGRLVIAGPVEATVFGNLLAQARTRGELRSLDEMR